MRTSSKKEAIHFVEFVAAQLCRTPAFFERLGNAPASDISCESSSRKLASSVGSAISIPFSGGESQ